MIPNVTTEVISNAVITVPSSLSSRIVREDNYVQLNITITEYHFHRELTVISHAHCAPRDTAPAAPGGTFAWPRSCHHSRFKIPSNIARLEEERSTHLQAGRGGAWQTSLGMETQRWGRGRASHRDTLTHSSLGTRYHHLTTPTSHTLLQVVT